MTPEPFDAHLLVEHREFLRALARRLLADEHRADDVVQEACIAALHGPRPARGDASEPTATPATPANGLAWLAAVVRNLALNVRRGEGRRASRERAHATDSAGEARPGPDQIAARVGLQGHLADALLDLPEVYRTAVYLRFYEDLPPREVARALGVGVETARSRVRRGIEELRRRLDDRYGERGAWSVVLAPLALSTRARDASAIAVGSGAAPGWPLFAVAAGLIALATAVVLAVGPPADRDEALRVAEPLAERALDVASAPRRTAADPTARSAIAPAERVRAQAPGAAQSRATRRLRGLVLDARTGEAVPELLVRVDGAPLGEPASFEARTDGAGRFELDWQDGEARPVPRFLDGPEGRALPAARTGPGDEPDAWRFAVAVGPTYRIDAALPSGLEWTDFELRLVEEGRVLDGTEPRAARVRRGERPWARFERLPELSFLAGGTRSRFRLELVSDDRLWLATADVRARPGVYASDVTFELEPCGVVAGVVRSASGAEVAGAWVEVGARVRGAGGVDDVGGVGEPGPAVRVVTADAAGRFVVGPLTPGAWRVCATAHGASTSPPAVEVDVAAGRTTQLELALAALPTGPVSGVLTSRSGTHVPTGDVRLVDLDDPSRTRDVTPSVGERDGVVVATFRFDDVSPGRYALVPPPGDPLPFRPPRLELFGAAEGLRFECLDDGPRYTLALRVRDAGTGAPLGEFRAALLVDREALGKERALEDGFAVEQRTLGYGETYPGSISVGSPVFWVVGKDGYRTAQGTEALFRAEGGAAGESPRRVLEVELERVWRAELLVLARVGARLEPVRGARVVTTGGTPLATTLADGSAYLELSYDPGTIAVELAGWMVERWDGFDGGRRVVELDRHVVVLVPDGADMRSPMAANAPERQ